MHEYVSGLENKRGNPTVDFLDKLAAVLEVPMFEFFRLLAGGVRAGTLAALSLIGAGLRIVRAGPRPYPKPSDLRSRKPLKIFVSPIRF